MNFKVLNIWLSTVHYVLTNGANKGKILTCTRQDSGEMTFTIIPSLPARVRMLAESLILTSIFGRNLGGFCSGTTGSSSSIGLKKKIILRLAFLNLYKSVVYELHWQNKILRGKWAPDETSLFIMRIKFQSSFDQLAQPQRHTIFSRVCC